jgi:hypothetical protein
VSCKVCEIATELELFVVSSCKRTVDLITNPQLRQSEVVGLQMILDTHCILVTVLVLSPSMKDIPRLSLFSVRFHATVTCYSTPAETVLSRADR